MKLFLQLQKVDLEKRLVYGRATQEIMDKSGEVFDYATSRPLFEAWSASAQEATKAAGQEASYGNVRAMHGNVAAGKLSEPIAFDDVEKSLDVCAYVADDNEWQKVQKGIYTGFSIGGDYAKRWTDDTGTRRFTANPAEISLVDNPCVPTARFTMVKADGLEEATAFAKVDGAEPDEELAASTDAALVGVAPDPTPDPTHTPDPAPAAVVPVADPAPVAEVVADAPAPAQAEPTEAEKATASELEKAGARHSAADKARLQGIHDHAVSMGAACGGSDKAAGDALQKLQQERVDALAKVADLEKTVATLTARVTELEAEPVAPKGVATVVAVTKAEDNGTPTPDPFIALDRAAADGNVKQMQLEAMKLALAQPRRLN